MDGEASTEVAGARTVTGAGTSSRTPMPAAATRTPTPTAATQTRKDGSREAASSGARAGLARMLHRACLAHLLRRAGLAGRAQAPADGQYGEEQNHRRHRHERAPRHNLLLLLVLMLVDVDVASVLLQLQEREWRARRVRHRHRPRLRSQHHLSLILAFSCAPRLKCTADSTAALLGSTDRGETALQLCHLVVHCTAALQRSSQSRISAPPPTR